MATAISFDSVPIREIGAKVQSFDAYQRKQRVRLTSDEAWPIRYVFCEWAGEAGMGSSASQLEKLAALPELLKELPADPARAEKVGQKRMRKAIRRTWTDYWDADGQVMVAKATPPAFRDTYAATERWADSMLRAVPQQQRVANSEKGAKVRRAWGALRRMSVSRPTSLMILHALYGDRPPGLIDGVHWTRDVNAEYVRVVRWVDGSGGSAAALEPLLAVDKRRREGESDEALKTRVAAVQEAKTALLARLARGCESLIATATEDYRFALGKQAAT